MARRGPDTHAIEQHDPVPAWPRIAATVRPDGTGTLTINGTERPCAAAGIDELRTGMIARSVAIAARLRRPVRLTVTDALQAWAFAVRPEGIVQLLDAAGTIPPATGLTAHEGRCRRCRRLQPVTAATCVQCGLSEPHRVEADPVPAEAVVPDADAAEEIDERTQLLPRRHQSRRPTLRLTFNTQAIDVAENVAIGRNPEPVDGRKPLSVASPRRTLSRTHVLIDVDDHGRIVVTDHGSGNGTEAQTDPPRKLTPHTPYQVEPGTTLRLGPDVTCTVAIAPGDARAAPA